jgi:hypothetical protein
MIFNLNVGASTLFSVVPFKNGLDFWAIPHFEQFQHCSWQSSVSFYNYPWCLKSKLFPCDIAYFEIKQRTLKFSLSGPLCVLYFNRPDMEMEFFCLKFFPREDALFDKLEWSMKLKTTGSENQIFSEMTSNDENTLRLCNSFSSFLRFLTEQLHVKRAVFDPVEVDKKIPNNIDHPLMERVLKVDAAVVQPSEPEDIELVETDDETTAKRVLFASPVESNEIGALSPVVVPVEEKEPPGSPCKRRRLKKYKRSSVYQQRSLESMLTGHEINYFYEENPWNDHYVFGEPRYSVLMKNTRVRVGTSKQKTCFHGLFSTGRFPVATPMATLGAGFIRTHGTFPAGKLLESPFCVKLPGSDYILDNSGYDEFPIHKAKFCANTKDPELINAKLVFHRDHVFASNPFPEIVLTRRVEEGDEILIKHDVKDIKTDMKY